MVWVDETPYTLSGGNIVEELVDKSLVVTEENAGKIEVEFDIAEPVSPEAS